MLFDSSQDICVRHCRVRAKEKAMRSVDVNAVEAQSLFENPPGEGPGPTEMAKSGDFL
jgi:hypothetical protein